VHKPIKLEKVDSNDNRLSGILLDNQIQVIPGQIIQSVNGQQLFIHSAAQDASQLIRCGLQNEHGPFPPKCIFVRRRFRRILFRNHVQIQ